MAVAYNENIEVSVLSVVLKNKENYQIIQDIVQQSYFWWKPFAHVWKCFENLTNEQLGIDSLSLANELDRNGWLSNFAILSVSLSGKEGVEYLADFNVVETNAETYAYELVEAYSSRKLNDLFEKEKEAIQKGIRSKDILSDLDIETGKISTLIGAKTNSIVPIKIASDEALSATIEAMEGRGSIIPTGLNYIDYFTCGLARQRVIMIAGGTGDGKTAESSSIINQVSVLNKERKTMGWISIEMDRKECVNRLICNNTGIPALRFYTGKI
jgi:replicative DNA helicase